MTTFLSLVNAVLERAGQETVTTLSNAVSPVTQTMAYLNDIYTEMSALANPAFLSERTSFSTQSGVSLYAVASQTDVTRIFKNEVYNTTTGARLYELGPDQLQSADFATLGTPSRYWFEAGEIRLYPTPNGIFNMSYRYTRMPNPLANDNDTVEFPTDWQLVLVRGAQSLLEKFLGESDNGRTSYLMYLEGLMLLKTRQRMQSKSVMQGFYHVAPPQDWSAGL